MADMKLFVTDFAKSDNKIEWLRFEDGSPMPELLQSTTHIAYTVENLDKELEGAEILIEPFEVSEGVRLAFIIEEGAPIELMETGAGY